MKPFNLEEALKDPSKVCTGEGEDVLELHLFNVIDDAPLVAAIKAENYIREKRTYSKHGIWLPYNNPSKHDLFMKSDKKSGWINIHGFKNPSCSTSSGEIFKTKEEAMAAVLKRDFTYKDTVKIEWEE